MSVRARVRVCLYERERERKREKKRKNNTRVNRFKVIILFIFVCCRASFLWNYTIVFYLFVVTVSFWNFFSCKLRTRYFMYSSCFFRCIYIHIFFVIGLFMLLLHYVMLEKCCSHLRQRWLLRRQLKIRRRKKHKYIGTFIKKNKKISYLKKVHFLYQNNNTPHNNT